MSFKDGAPQPDGGKDMFFSFASGLITSMLLMGFFNNQLQAKIAVLEQNNATQKMVLDQKQEKLETCVTRLDSFKDGVNAGGR